MYIGEVEYSDRSLARILMRSLWRIFDAGGVTHGRSIKAGLLESVMEILGTAAMVDLKHSQIFDVFVKIKTYKVKTIVQLPLFTELKYIPNEDLVCLLLAKLYEWHKEREDDFPFDYTVVASICLLLGVSEHLKFFSNRRITFSPSELIEESKRRSWIHSPINDDKLLRFQ